jgi:flagellar hook-basal body protein
MGGAISIGTTGLSASSKQMDVIGNNLANSNTLGFKAASTLFAAMLNQSLAGSGAMSVGQGVTVAAISTQFAQGSFENTPNATDLAIDGNGFFMVKDIEGALYYTRAGAFHINKEGYLVDNTDYRVQGFNLFSADAAETADDISLSNVQSSASATVNISLGANLDAAQGYGGTFNVTQTVFDSLGGMHNLSLTFQRTEIPGMWGFDAALDGDPSVTTAQSACGLTFDSAGTIDTLYKGDVDNVAAGFKATGTITSTGVNVTAADTVTVNGKVYTFVAVPAVEGDVDIGATAAETLDNLMHAINHTGTPDTNYFCSDLAGSHSRRCRQCPYFDGGGSYPGPVGSGACRWQSDCRHQLHGGREQTRSTIPGCNRNRIDKRRRDRRMVGHCRWRLYKRPGMAGRIRRRRIPESGS